MVMSNLSPLGKVSDQQLRDCSFAVRGSLLFGMKGTFSGRGPAQTAQVNSANLSRSKERLNGREEFKKADSIAELQLCQTSFAASEVRSVLV